MLQTLVFLFLLLSLIMMMMITAIIIIMYYRESKVTSFVLLDMDHNHVSSSFKKSNLGIILSGWLGSKYQPAN